MIILGLRFLSIEKELLLLQELLAMMGVPVMVVIMVMFEYMNGIKITKHGFS